MKKFVVILLILIIITAISIYGILSYRTEVLQAQKLNREYESYLDVDFLGTQLISIINRTVDINEQNEIEKDEQGNYIENGKDSIKVYIKFIYKDKIKTISMESIASSGSEPFVKTYSTATFRCTHIEYHERTKNIKSLTFEEIQE